MRLSDTHNADRRETATDQRGLPRSFARALEGLKGSCAHCSKRAVVSNGCGIGLCAEHRGNRPRGSIAERVELRRQLEIDKRA